jgi:hypothetical protein
MHFAEGAGIEPACSSQALQGITAAVVGFRSIFSVGGPSIPFIPSCRFAPFIPAFPSSIF